MQSERSQIIVRRFFEALQILKANKIIRGKQTFTTRYGINRWNLNTLEKEPERDIFQVAWLEHLVNDYKVSPLWLLTGNGSFFADGWNFGAVKSMQKPEREKAKKPQKDCNEEIAVIGIIDNQ